MINKQKYDTKDKELRTMSSSTKNLIREYNMISAEDINEREKKIKEILGKYED
ncbi:maltose acetyltransferase domain-containing protein [uncultured Fusobacterium sp.]|uniref:maltose acetyltransferase domain-containing protein n=1 Tax=uncultured Fusobacterium sp. TaxID=159267 RepID=UPI0025F69586|nr:maltose acetyltransferase domain-containing protein [uncultured Fusobacterium sp.]